MSPESKSMELGAVVAGPQQLAWSQGCSIEFLYHRYSRQVVVVSISARGRGLRIQNRGSSGSEGRTAGAAKRSELTYRGHDCRHGKGCDDDKTEIAE